MSKKDTKLINVEMTESTIQLIIDATSALKAKLDEVRQKNLIVVEELFNVYEGISADRGFGIIEKHMSAVVSKLNHDVQQCDEIIRCLHNYQVKEMETQIKASDSYESHYTGKNVEDLL